jgi:hypothetical protein
MSLLTGSDPVVTGIACLLPFVPLPLYIIGVYDRPIEYNDDYEHIDIMFKVNDPLTDQPTSFAMAIRPEAETALVSKLNGYTDDSTDHRSKAIRLKTTFESCQGTFHHEGLHGLVYGHAKDYDAIHRIVSDRRMRRQIIRHIDHEIQRHAIQQDWEKGYNRLYSSDDVPPHEVGHHASSIDALDDAADCALSSKELDDAAESCYRLLDDCQQKIEELGLDTTNIKDLNHTLNRLHGQSDKLESEHPDQNSAQDFIKGSYIVYQQRIRRIRREYDDLSTRLNALHHQLLVMTSDADLVRDASDRMSNLEIQIQQAAMMTDMHQ